MAELMILVPGRADCGRSHGPFVMGQVFDLNGNYSEGIWGLIVRPLAIDNENSSRRLIDLILTFVSKFSPNPV